jgi:type II secretory pathway pseudopilin PulG
MKKKLSSIAGLTLVEILIAVVISALMMAAMFTSYSIVNSTYRQVTDRAKISQAGRDLVGQILREVRMAGYKYVNDNITTSDNPIKITKGTGIGSSCDKIEIVFGGIEYDKSAAEDDRISYTRYKITYECKKSTIIDDTIPGGADFIEGFAVYKSKYRWNTTSSSWSDPATDSDETTYEDEKILDYVQDLVFIPFDEDGIILQGSPFTPLDSDAKNVKTVDISIVVRSSKAFYRSKAMRTITSIATDRDIEKEDKYFRDSITVTANTRNLGL